MKQPTKYYLLSGEASGDLHAANLVKAMQHENSNTEFRSWGGGDQMESLGIPVAKHYRELAFMGFITVVRNLPAIIGNFKKCKADILNFKPDYLILVDYPGFNLRMCAWAHSKGIPIIYYIAPQLWAWKKSRIKYFKQYVKHLLLILPFEEQFFNNEGYKQVTYVGHPLLDHISTFQKDDSFHQKYQLSNKPIIALLPGSRKQEIKSMLPIFLDIISYFPGYQFIIGGAPGQQLEFYQSFFKNANTTIPVIFGATYQLLAHAHAALVTSGTATLETALFKVPQVVCYKANQIEYEIAKRLVQVDYISLVNLIVNQELVTELIQGELHQERLKEELTLILSTGKRAEILASYEKILERLGKGGASAKAASVVLSFQE